MFLHAVHRYEIAPAEGGSTVHYLLSAKLTLQAPPGDMHPRLPAVIFNLIVPAVIERGTKNLVTMAEQRAGVVHLASPPFAPPRRAAGQQG